MASVFFFSFFLDKFSKTSLKVHCLEVEVFTLTIKEDKIHMPINRNISSIFKDNCKFLLSWVGTRVQFIPKTCKQDFAYSILHQSVCNCVLNGRAYETLQTRFCDFHMNALQRWHIWHPLNKNVMIYCDRWTLINISSFTYWYPLK